MSNTPIDLLKRLRDLRRTVRELNRTMIDDLKPFIQKENGMTFRRLPYSDLPPKDKDIGVTVTCTALMALATAEQLSDFYDGDNNKAKMALGKILSATWKSSGLHEGNKFT